MAEPPRYVAAAYKRYLSSLIRDNVDVFSGGHTSKESIIQSITSVCHFAAKCRHRASRVMLASALHFYNDREDAFPDIFDNLRKASTFVMHAFNVNLGFWSYTAHPTEIPERVVDMMNWCYPINLIEDDEGERAFSGYFRIIQSLANTYATCAGNHAKMNYFTYQDKTIIDFLRSRGHKHPKKSCGPLIKWIKRQINNEDAGEDDIDDDILDELVPDEPAGNGNVNGGLNADDIQRFIEFHRSFFVERGIEDAVINDDWVENDANIGVIILYFVHLLTYQQR